MSDPKLETLRGLAALDDWRNIAGLLDEAAFRDLSPEVSGLFTALGVQHEAARNWIRALHCYRIAVWSNALYGRDAPDSAERQRRWWSGEAVQRKFLGAQRKLLKRGPHVQVSG